MFLWLKTFPSWAKASLSTEEQIAAEEEAAG
jgi:hypothetical protein